MNKLVRSIVHFVVLIVFFATMGLISMYSGIKPDDPVLLGVALIPGFILMHIGCDLFEDPDRWYTKFFHYFFKWVGGIAIFAMGFILQLMMATEIEGQTLHPVANGFLSPWLVTAVVAIVLYGNIDTSCHQNHIPFIPLISYGIGVVFAILLGLLGRYVMSIFYAWFPLMLLLLIVVLEIIALIKGGGLYIPDFDDMINKTKKTQETQETNLVEEMLQELRKNITMIDPDYWNESNYPKYMSWYSSNGKYPEFKYDLGKGEYKINMPGKVVVNKSLVNNPIADKKNINYFCKEYIKVMMEGIINENPTKYGTIDQWKKNDWANINVDLDFDIRY